jgi:membrane protein DedA with SNARE-associated domain
MPFAGFLVSGGQLSFFWVAVWGTVGNLIGSAAAYLAGFYGGRPFIERYGKWLLITKEDIDKAENWFRKYGSVSVFFSRMLPVVRTFISLPAGMARMPFAKFSLYTFLGSLPWAIVLTYIGVIMGENWQGIEVHFRRFDWLIAILAVIFLAWWILRRFKKPKTI